MIRKLKVVFGLPTPLSKTMASVARFVRKLEVAAKKHPGKLILLIFTMAAGLTATMALATRLVMQ